MTVIDLCLGSLGNDIVRQIIIIFKHNNVCDAQHEEYR